MSEETVCTLRKKHLSAIHLTGDQYVNYIKRTREILHTNKSDSYNLWRKDQAGSSSKEA